METLYIIFIVLVSSQVMYCQENPEPPNKGDMEEPDMGDLPVISTQAPPVKVPYQVLIMKLAEDGKETYICSGTLFKENEVLTAAHCLMDQGKSIPGESLKIYAGSVNIKEPGKSSSNVKGSPNGHPDFSNDLKKKIKKNNIAKLTLETPFVLGETISILGARQVAPAANAKCTVAGVGKIEEPEQSKGDRLKQVNVVIKDKTACNTLFSSETGQNLPDGVLCAGVDNQPDDNCQADPGSPLVCDNQLAGIASFTGSCNDSIIYTDVAQYTKWLTPTPEEDSNSKASITSRALILIIFIQIFTYFAVMD